MKNKKIKIKYFDLWGLRKDKYKFLESHNVKNTKWQDLELKEPHCFFITRDTEGEEIYQDFISVKDIFLKHNAGIASGKDEVLVDFNKKNLIRRLSVVEKDLFGNIMENYKVSKDLTDKWYQELKNKDIENQIKDYNYRLFDKRFIIYNPKILQRARKNIMDNFLFDNVGICTSKQLSTNQFYHSFVTDSLTDRCYISLQTRELGYVFPLFIYSRNGQNQLFDKEIGRQVNFSDELWNNVPTGIEPEKIFNYIYAILYSNIYRKKYNEFLKIDFPRIPFTKDAELFYKIAELGGELVDLHLLKSKRLEKIGVAFPIVGDNKVRKREYKEKEGQLYINDKQYFGTITSKVWNYNIGGYRILDKWLKDRTDKILSTGDVNHFLKITTALVWTVFFQKEIDKIYPKIEKDLVKPN